MPLYEYRCKSCGDTFEALQKFSDEPLKVHAKCGGEVERLLSAPGLQFKGTGWYVTDYGRGKSSAGNGTTKSSGTKTESSGSETKASATKTETPAKS